MNVDISSGGAGFVQSIIHIDGPTSSGTRQPRLGFGLKVGQNRPEWDKSGTFSDQIRTFLLAELISDLKKKCQLSHLGQSDPRFA